jgi:hypothetical protein
MVTIASAVQDNVVPLIDANEPSVGERAFRTLFDSLSRSNLPLPVRLTHLKGSLRGWMLAAKMPGCSPEAMGATLSKSDEGLLKQLENVLSDALAKDWSLRRLLAVLKAAAIAEHGIEL